jgi:hypothetical protein
MKNYIHLTITVLSVIILSCRSKEVLIPFDDIKKPAIVSKKQYLLKSVNVEGATEVKVDDSLGIIQVILPSDYLSKNISMDLGFQLGGRFWSVGGVSVNSTNYPNRTNITVNYAGNRPMELVIQDSAQINPKRDLYKIYVKHLGKPNAKIKNISYSVSTQFSVSVTLDIISGIGTIPSNPDKPESNLILFRKTGTSVNDTCKINSLIINQVSGKLEKYVPFENKLFTLELVKDNERLIIKDDITFTRDNTYIYSYRNHIHNDALSLLPASGYFSPLDKYKIRLNNAFMNNPVELDIETNTNDYRNLNIKIPSSFPRDSYIITILENGKAISPEGILTIANSINDKSFLKLWKTNAGSQSYSSQVNDMELGKIPYRKGDTLSVIPYSPISAKNLLNKEDIPLLKLRTNNKSIELTPVVQIFHWTIAFISYYGFYYTIPKDIETGFYEVRLVYPNGEESNRYWNKLEIR